MHTHAQTHINTPICCRLYKTPQNTLGVAAQMVLRARELWQIWIDKDSAVAWRSYTVINLLSLIRSSVCGHRLAGIALLTHTPIHTYMHACTHSDTYIHLHTQ